MSAKDVARGSLTAEQLAEYTDALTRHYGEPVRPVGAYCDALRTWARCLVERKQRVEAMADDDPMKQHELQDPLTRLADQAWGVQLAISKSCLLNRLIYMGEPVRTEMCPVHEGRGSGYGDAAFGREHICECQLGAYDITGWLPTHDRPLIEKVALFAKAKGWEPASWARHYPASSDYDDAQPYTAAAGGLAARGATLAEAAEALAEQLRERDGFSA